MSSLNTEVTDVVLSKYLSLMEEIKKREQVIIGLYDGTCNAKYKIVNYEVMFFQLRKILELIVKAPMIINENEYREISRSPERDWRIRDVMKKLKEANPKSYPEPITIEKISGLPDKFNTREEGFLTQDLLCEAYDHCNGFLHAQNPLSDESEVKFDDEWRFICATLEQIHNLLNPHLANPTKDGHFYFVGMQNNTNGAVHGNIFGTADA